MGPMRTLRLPLVIALAAALLGCAGRSVKTATPQPWVPPLVTGAVCKEGLPALYDGPRPGSRYQIGVVVEIDARGDVASARVVDRWPANDWTSIEDKPWEEVELEWIRRQWEISPALWGGRPVKSSLLRVLTIPARDEFLTEADELIERLLDRPPRAGAFTPPRVLEETSRDGPPQSHGEQRPSKPYTACVLIGVSERGRAKSARVVSRSPDTLSPFEQPWEAAWLEWIRRDWRFEPATHDGKAVKGELLRVIRLRAADDAAAGEVLTLQQSTTRGGRS